MVHDLGRCAVIRHRIDKWAAKADACFEAQEWEGSIECIEIYSQAEWLAKDADLLPDERYRTLLRGIHQNQRTTVGKRELFNRLFRADRPGREPLMTPEEREVLAKLPDVLAVSRGYSDDDDEGFADGIAWTLDRRAAVWYANWCRDIDYPA